MPYFEQVQAAAGEVRKLIGGITPRILMVLGSGLNAAADYLRDPVVVPYAEIPNFPRSTVEGHTGRLVAGYLGETPVFMMQGRVHYYEGYRLDEVSFPLRVLGSMGVRTVVLTNAAGGIQEGYQVGQLVLIADHINMMGFNPLRGPNEPRLAVRPGAGQRFVDMTEAYSKELREVARQAAREEGFELDEGVYLAVSGPSFETPAEIRAFRTLGATLVGMSTVPETIAARHMGMNVLGISFVSNIAAGLADRHLSHEEVFEEGLKIGGRLAGLLTRLAPKLDERVR